MFCLAFETCKHLTRYLTLEPVLTVVFPQLGEGGQEETISFPSGILWTYKKAGNQP